MSTSLSGTPTARCGRTGRVLVVGSVNVDLVVRLNRHPIPGETVMAREMSRLLGGKGANQAFAASKAGAEVAFVGAIGDDSGGREALDSLSADGIDVQHVVRRPNEPTGAALVLVADDGENEIVVVPGANATLCADDVLAAVEGWTLSEGDVCLISFEIPDQAVVAAAEAAQARGAHLLVNPAPARPLDARVTASRPILLPNASEAAVLTGHDDPTKGAAALAEATFMPVVVTVGSNGAVVHGDGPTRRHGATRVDVVDTTGAGDVFAGVLAALLARGVPLRSAVDHAVVGATLSVQRVGARGGAPSISEIEDALSPPGS